MRNEPQVVINLSNRSNGPMSAVEFELVNKGLSFAHFPLSPNIFRIRVEFEYLQANSFLFIDI